MSQGVLLANAEKPGLLTSLDRRSYVKITAVKPFIASTRNFFVKVETDAGIYGIGGCVIRKATIDLNRPEQCDSGLSK